MGSRGLSKKGDASAGGKSKSNAQKKVKRRKRTKEGKKVGRKPKGSSTGEVKARKKRSRDHGEGEEVQRRRKRTKGAAVTSSILCKHCGLSVNAGSGSPALELWDDSGTACARNQWSAPSHKFYVNLLDDAGYAAKRVDEAERLANNLQKRVGVVRTKYKCPEYRCKKEVASPELLQDHLISTHVKPELKKRRSLDRDARYAVLVKNKSTKLVRRKDNARLRRGLLPLVPCQTKYEKANKMLPERLYR